MIDRLKSVLEHVTTDGKFDRDKAKQMKGWLARLQSEHEWYPIICVLEHEGTVVAVLDDSAAPTKRKYLASDVLCVPADTVGHWTVNGRAFCRTNYDARIGERSLVCACKHQDYLGMSKALKDKYPDGSAKWVSYTRWHPTSCGERDDRDDQSPHQIQLHTRWYANLALLTEALEQVTGGVANTSSYEVSIWHEDWPNVDGDVPEMDHALVLRISRYTMNPLGMHVGYEEYEGVLEISEARGREKPGRPLHKWATKVVDIDSLQVRVTSAPEAEECACKTGDCSCALEDEEHCCSEDECVCELYSGADEDFAHEEVDNLLREALSVQLFWHFDRDDSTWRIVDAQTAETVWEPDPSKWPPPQAPIV
jgi:hypothetical protein